MIGRLLLYASIVALAVLGFVQWRHGAAMRPVKAATAAAGADVAPELTLPDLEAKKVSLSSLRGKPVLLNFWATWCPPCRAELPELQKLSQERPCDLAVVGVTEDSGSATDIRSFVHQRGVTYPVLIDDGSAGSAYNVVTIPHSVLIDAEGHQLGVFRGGVTAWGVKDALRSLPGAPRC